MTTKKRPIDPADFTGQPVSLRIPRDLHQAIVARAAADDRSMAATIREACRYYLANTGESQP